MARELQKQHDVGLPEDQSVMQRVRAVAEKVKCQLSSIDEVQATLKEIVKIPSGEILDFNFSLTRAKFEALVAPLVERSMKVCDEALKLAGLKASDLDNLVLVGGTTRVPLVRKQVAKHFGIMPRSEINPDEVVAIGAAIQAFSLTGEGLPEELPKPVPKRRPVVRTTSPGHPAPKQTLIGVTRPTLPGTAAARVASPKGPRKKTLSLDLSKHRVGPGGAKREDAELGLDVKREEGEMGLDVKREEGEMGLDVKRGEGDLGLDVKRGEGDLDLDVKRGEGDLDLDVKRGEGDLGLDVKSEKEDLGLDVKRSGGDLGVDVKRDAPTPIETQEIPDANAEAEPIGPGQEPLRLDVERDLPSIDDATSPDAIETMDDLGFGEISLEADDKPLPEPQPSASTEDEVSDTLPAVLGESPSYPDAGVDQGPQQPAADAIDESPEAGIPDLSDEAAELGETGTEAKWPEVGMTEPEKTADQPAKPIPPAVPTKKFADLPMSEPDPLIPQEPLPEVKANPMAATFPQMSVSELPLKPAEEARLEPPTAEPSKPPEEGPLEPAALESFEPSAEELLGLPEEAGLSAPKEEPLGLPEEAQLGLPEEEPFEPPAEAPVDSSLQDEVVAAPGATTSASLAPPERTDSHTSIVIPPQSTAQSALLLDVTPRALGIAVAGGFCDIIIERNAAIPVEQSRLFSTSRDNQTQVAVTVYQGESRRIDENTELGQVLLTNLRPAPRGEIKIRVTFEIDTDGILGVSARNEETNQAERTKIVLTGGMDEEKVEALVKKYADK
jgi:hypothetical protein